MGLTTDKCPSLKYEFRPFENISLGKQTAAGNQKVVTSDKLSVVNSPLMGVKIFAPL